MRFFLKHLVSYKAAAIFSLLLISQAIAYGQTPTIAVDDTIGLCEGTLVVINVAANDIDPDIDEELKIDVLIGPSSPEISYSEDGDSTIEIIVSPFFSGTDVIVYEVCGEDDYCDIGTVYITVDGTSNCVWPGDANVDSICNHFDLLPIGVYYGNNGPDRYDEDGGWEGSFCDEWYEDPDYVISPNPKFADCNGDGFVDELDTVIISNNFGQLHGTYSPETYIGGPTDPMLGIGFFTDTIEAGSEVVIPLNFGTAEIPASNIYGIAFELNYDETLVVPGSVKVTFNSGWLGEPVSDLISLQNNDTINGVVSVGVTRKNQISRTGFGHLGEVSFVMEDNIAGKTLSEITKTANFCIEFPQTRNNFGNPVNINPICDSIVIFQISDAIENSEGTYLQIYPNPANEILNIYMPQNSNGICVLQNIFGQTIKEKNIESSGVISFGLKDIPAGNYFISIKTSNSVITKKIIIQH